MTAMWHTNEVTVVGDSNLDGQHGLKKYWFLTKQVADRPFSNVFHERLANNV